MPSSTRAKVDLPEPEAPSTTVTVPAGMMALTPRKMGSLRPGAEATTSFKTTSPLGVMPMGAFSRTGCASSKSAKRAYASLALKKPAQVPTIKSMGASARVVSTLAAIMAPGDNSP